MLTEVAGECTAFLFKRKSTGVGQINGKTTDTVHILSLIWCWTIFVFNTATVLLGTDSYKFWTVSSRTVYHSSWRIPSSYFRDVGVGNLFLNLVSKTDQSISMVFKYGDYGGHGRCWSSPSCFSNQDWTVSAVWMGTLLSWKTTSLFGNNVWIVGCTWLPNLFTYSLAVIGPWNVIMGPTVYHDIAA
jgi:hypothetical protein